jgi:hypothetical protein
MQPMMITAVAREVERERRRDRHTVELPSLARANRAPAAADPVGDPAPVSGAARRLGIPSRRRRSPKLKDTTPAQQRTYVKPAGRRPSGACVAMVHRQYSAGCVQVGGAGRDENT